MKVLLSWLREFAPIDGDPQELAEGWQNFLELMGDNIQLAQSIGLIKGSSVKANEPPPKEDEE